VGLEHLGQSVLLLVSMTFARSPVLAIFAIMILPWYLDLAYRALADHRTGFVGPSWTGSAGTSQLDLHGVGPKAAAGDRGEELRDAQCLSLPDGRGWSGIPRILRSGMRTSGID
jgi:hypothetical protein